MNVLELECSDWAWIAVPGSTLAVALVGDGKALCGREGLGDASDWRVLEGLPTAGMGLRRVDTSRKSVLAVREALVIELEVAPPMSEPDEAWRVLFVGSQSAVEREETSPLLHLSLEL